MKRRIDLSEESLLALKLLQPGIYAVINDYLNIPVTDKDGYGAINKKRRKYDLTHRPAEALSIIGLSLKAKYDFYDSSEEVI